LAAARKMAGDSVRAMYGRSTVNGTAEVLKYAPEKMFGLPPEVVRESLRNDLAGVGYTGNPDEVRLTMSPATERSKGVWWHLTAPDEYGVPDVILGKDNRPVEYALPIGQAFEDARSSIKKRKEDEFNAERAKYEASVDGLQNSFIDFNADKYK
jgi:hypothetical protein